MGVKERRKKLRETKQVQCAALGATKTPGRREVWGESPWRTICELFGREWDGYTYYYSKRLERDQLGVIYDWPQEELEIRLVPQPYGTSNEDPDFEVQIRPLRKGEPLELVYVEELEREDLR
jgi:hypothetical protein